MCIKTCYDRNLYAYGGAYSEFYFIPILTLNFLFTKKHLGLVSVNNIKSNANASNYALNNWQIKTAIIA